jgi:Protein of unknown function (DUF4031)
MAILVDPAVWPGRGRYWSHLVSDTSFAELHAFARRLDIPPRAFERDHYDLPAELRDRAVALGAVPVSSRELVARLTAAGLRRPKGRRVGPPSAAGQPAGEPGSTDDPAPSR